MIHRDACHCGAVRFEVEAPEEVEVEDCDCSIGRMSGFLHLVVPKSRFYVQAVRAIRVLRASGSGLRGERASRQRGPR